MNPPGGARAGWPYPRVLAHRGGGTLAPENTLGAIRHGASLGFRGVEFDVMLAGDATPVLIHDATLERTTNGKGAVARMPYSEIARFDAGRWLAERWSGQHVPLFAEAGRLCRELGVWANVEIKPAKGFEAQTGQAVAEMALELWRGAELPPVLSSFAPGALAAARAAVPELPRGMLLGRIPADWKARMLELDCVALHCNYQALTQSLLDEVHAAGYAVLVWTVNDPREAKKLFDWGVDCIVTDRLDLIGPGFAQTTSTPRIDQRQANRERRIEQGVKSGQLTAKEAARLEKGQARVQKMEAKAAADGKVTKKERAKIERAQDQQSRKIAREKHDKQHK